MKININVLSLPIIVDIKDQGKNSCGESGKVHRLAAADDGGAGGGGAGLDLVSLVDEGKVSPHQLVEARFCGVHFLLPRQLLFKFKTVLFFKRIATFLLWSCSIFLL